MDWNQRFKTEVTTGSSMAWMGESVRGSFSRPHHHKGRIWKDVEGFGKVWKDMEVCRRVGKDMEGYGMMWKN